MGLGPGGDPSSGIRVTVGVETGQGGSAYGVWSGYGRQEAGSMLTVET